MFELVITADTNDADYVTAISTVTQADIDMMLPIIAAIKAKGPRHNWAKGEIGDYHSMYPDMDEELLDWFDESFVPYGEYGIHTIKTIEYYPLPEKIRLL